MKKQSRTVPRRRQSVSPTPRHLPLVDILIDTQAELQELVVASGLKVLEAMLEEDRAAVCGPRYAHQPARQAYRTGHTPSQVVLGGRKVAIRRPRARRALESPVASSPRARGRSGRRAPGGGSRLSTGAEAGTRAPSSASLPRAVVPDGRGVVRASWLTDLGALWGLGLRRPHRLLQVFTVALISRKGGAGKTPRDRWWTRRAPSVRTRARPGHCAPSRAASMPAARAAAVKRR